jgi:hypothetical protein
MRTILMSVASLAICLTVRADAPPSHYTYPEEGTVHDTGTGLTWQRKVEDKLRTTAEAAGYCAALPLANGGWRVPTRYELLTLVDPTVDTPALDHTAFPDGVPNMLFWTSTLRVEVQNGETTWIVDFSAGKTASGGGQGITAAHHVRCVR